MHQDQNQEVTPNPSLNEKGTLLEDVDMNQANNDDLEYEQVIKVALGGVNLNTILEVWEKNNLEAIAEEYIQKIEGAYLIQEELKYTTTKRLQGDHNTNGIISNTPIDQDNPKGLGRKRGRKKTSQLLQELGSKLINEEKVRSLTLTPNIFQ